MKIIHISDLHFGTERPGLTEALLYDIKRIQADLIVISGDLTQRARASQFVRAQEFIAKLNTEVLIVPGNHDIALYNLFERFFYPYKMFKHYLNTDLTPMYSHNNITLVGLNSVTPYKPMGGYITSRQLNKIKNFFHKRESSKEIRIVVMHHNLIRSERHKNINQAEEVIELFSECGVNLVLSGHIHSPHVEQLKRSYLTKNMYVVTAGTAISDRTIAPNSYNLLQINPTEFKLTVNIFEDDEFRPMNEQLFSF